MGQEGTYMERTGRLEDLKVGNYAYLLSTEGNPPRAIRVVVDSIEPSSKVGFIDITVEGANFKVTFSVNPSDEFSSDNALMVAGLIFPRIDSLVEYTEKLKSSAVNIKNGWLSVTDHTPEEFQRIKCAPDSFSYTEDAYYLNGKYVKEGYRKNLNKYITYWKEK